MLQQEQGILVLGLQALTALVKAGLDDLAAHAEALLTWQARLLGEQPGLREEVGCQGLQRARATLTWVPQVTADST